MGKKRTITIGSVVKGRKDPLTNAVKPDHIKISKDINLKAGDYLNLKSKETLLNDLVEAVNAGRMSEESAAKIAERHNNIPDFVRFEIQATVEE